MMIDREIKEKVRALLHRNMIRGYSESTGVHYHYTKPSFKPYASQYFWDTCFHSIIFTALDELDMAKSHIESLFSLKKKMVLSVISSTGIKFFPTGSLISFNRNLR